MLQCGFVRSNFAFVMVSRPSWCFLLPTTGLQTGAGEGNRTLVVSLEGFCSTIELHPQLPNRANTYAESVGGGGRIRTFVDAKSADLQSAAIDRSATPPNLRYAARDIACSARRTGARCSQIQWVTSSAKSPGAPDCPCGRHAIQGSPCAP